MKTSKQDIHDLLAAIANDVEEIKAQLGGTAGATVRADIATDAGAAGNNNAISNDVAVGNGGTTSNANRILAEITRLLEPIAQICGKLPNQIKSYYAQLLLRIPQDLREELFRDNNTRKRKGQLTVEDKIDNSLTMLISIYDRLNQLEDTLRPDISKLGQSGRKQSANGKSTNDKSAKSRIMVWFKSVWPGVRQLCAKRQNRWYRKPHILFVVIIYLLYFTLSIYSWQRWHHYRTENTRLRFTADKYRVDSIILREFYPQAAITLSAYEHITESEGADKAIEVFRGNSGELKSSYKPKQNPNE